MALSCCSFFHAGNLFWIWFYHPIQNPCALYALHCPVSQQSYAAICQPGRKEHQCSRENIFIYIRALHHLQAACTHFDLYSHSLPVFLSCREEARSAQGVGKTSRCVDYGDTGQECLPHLCLSEPYKTKTAAAAKMTGYREHHYCCVRFFSCKTTAPVLPSCIKGAKNIVFPWVSPWLRLCSALPRAGGAALSLIRRAVQCSPQRDGACRGLYPNACSKCLGIVRISVQLGKQVRRECRHE